MIAVPFSRYLSQLYMRFRVRVPSRVTHESFEAPFSAQFLLRNL